MVGRVIVTPPKVKRLKCDLTENNICYPGEPTAETMSTIGCPAKGCLEKLILTVEFTPQLGDSNRSSLIWYTFKIYL